MFKFRNNVNYQVSYLPTNRSRKVRRADLRTTVDFYLPEVTSKDAPVAFKVTDINDKYHMALYENTKVEAVTMPVRLYNGKLYRESVKYYPEKLGNWTDIIYYYSFLNVQDGTLKHSFNCAKCNDTYLMPHYRYYLEKFKSIVLSMENYDYPLTNESKLVSSTLEDEVKKARAKYDKYLIIDGRLYEQTDEPRYCYLNYNGCSALAIKFDYSIAVSKKQYFRADEFADFYKRAIQSAQKRHNDFDIKVMRNCRANKSLYIDVQIPQAIKINPQKEASI